MFGWFGGGARMVWGAPSNASQDDASQDDVEEQQCDSFGIIQDPPVGGSTLQKQFNLHFEDEIKAMQTKFCGGQLELETVQSKLL